MTSPPHILILGAGLIGLSSADALLRLGANVTLVEKESAPMRGASYANSGMIHPSQACSWAGSANDPETDAAVFDLACRSWTLMEGRMSELGLIDMLSRPAGCFQLFDEVETAKAARDRLRARKIATELRSGKDSVFARPTLFFPDDHSGDARAYGEALARSVRERGTTILTDRAEGVLTQDEAGRAQFSGVETPFDHIVVAAGADSNALLEPLGLQLPLQTVCGWAADFDRPDYIIVPTVPVMDAKSRSALTVLGQTIRLSGTWGEESIAPLLARWSVIAPDMMEQLGEPRSIWSGRRPVSELGRPFIGPTDIPGLWVNTGHGHMGWTLCAASGALLAEMMLSDVSDDRFAVVGAP